VVLGRGFHPPTAGCPLTSQVDAVLMTRLMEAVRVCRLLPESRIIVSLAGEAPVADKERFLEQFAALVALAPDRFEAVSDARDTGEEVRAFCSLAPGRQLVLVTSAAHMPRAMSLFRRYGVEPVAAPCGHRVQPPIEAEGFSASALFPSPSALRDADEALHEYLGLAWDGVGAWWR
jgi:uncharacterized SAM-binding protein YcdF (DUF218 family)